MMAATALCLSAGMVLGIGCRGTEKETTKSPPRIENMSKGPIEVIFTAEPPQVRFDRDILLTIRITAPSEIEVNLPQLDDRLQGFRLSGFIDEEPIAQAGKVTRERHARLTPILSREYRIAPMAIVYTDHSRSPAETGWFPTRPLLFDPIPPIKGKAGKDIEAVLSPVWIHPPAKMVLLYIVIILGGIGLLFVLWKLLRKVHRTIRLMRMSPRERALHDLAELLAKDLIGRNLVKEFYLELTLIVRQYIERAHAIRAPEQTTEEFLVAVSHDPRFNPDTVKKLKLFLEAADLVKFAAYRPAPDAIDKATSTAREYVETDAEDRESAANGKQPETTAKRER
jgi:hypothetical protein